MNLHFLDKRPICKNCKFCDFIVHEDEFDSYGFDSEIYLDKYIHNNSYEYICKLMPTPVKKSPKDWCGQYKESELDLNYILSFDEDKILRQNF
jgi:hypothetical protein